MPRRNLEEMERDPELRTDELVLGPVDDGRRPSWLTARGLPVLVVVAVLVAVGVSTPGLLSGTPSAPQPTSSPSASGGDVIPTATWTGGTARGPDGNTFVQSSTRLLRLPAT
ncbi:MAG TPA: hypothetical protein VFV76_01000 [Actinomycetes bacterium]|nr:hypothetical protein [Actinomycetes bacterium]